MYEKIFYHNEDTWCTKYQIGRKKALITIKYNHYPLTMKDPDEYTDIFHMHVENIPAFVKAITDVFYASAGGYESRVITGHGDEIIISMDTEMGIKPLNILGRRESNSAVIIEFVFDAEEVTYMPATSRIPTPAMTWVMDTLKKIHTDWLTENKKQKNGFIK